jgi:hypothetical protein
MTALFAHREINRRQDDIVRHMETQDLPAAENSLRFAPDSPVMEALDRPQYRRLAGSDDVWCGRLYAGALRVPTTTSLPSDYQGLESNRLSGNRPEFLESLFREPVHTHEEVLTSPPLDKPRQCGVSSRLAPASADCGGLVSIAAARSHA